jgi:hypothetical protein
LKRAAALTSVVLVLLAGCGSDSLSTKQLRSDATRVCTQADAQTAALAVPRTPGGTEIFLERGVWVLTRQLVALRKLSAPSDFAKTYDTALGAFQLELSALSSTAHSLAHGGDPVSGTQALERRLAPLESREDAAWRTLQIPACLNR